MSKLALSASFEYLCYGSTAIIKSFSSFSVDTAFMSDFRRRQYEDGPRAVRVKHKKGIRMSIEFAILECVLILIAN